MVDPSNYRKGHDTNNTITVSKTVVLLYWPEIFIFWTTLLQTCISTTHILSQAEKFARFIKAWYRVLDLTRIEVSRTLKTYISKSLSILIFFVLGMIIMFLLPFHFPYLHGTAMSIVIAVVQPFIVIFDLKDDQTMLNGKYYFEVRSKNQMPLFYESCL